MDDEKKTEIKVVKVDEVKTLVDETIQEQKSAIKDINTRIQAVEEKAAGAVDKVEELAQKVLAPTEEDTEMKSALLPSDWEDVVKRSLVRRENAVMTIQNATGLIKRALTSTEWPGLITTDGPNMLSRPAFRFVDLYSPKALAGDTIRVYRETTRSANVGVHTTITGTASSGATTVTVASAAGLAAGQPARLYDASGFEAVTISSISGTTVTLGAALSRTFASGSHFQTVYEIGATAEAAMKPETDSTLAGVDLNLRTVAVTLPVAEQRLKSQPMLEGWIREILAMKVRRALEVQLLYGANTTAELAGLLTDSDVQTHLWSNDPTGSNRLDAIIYAESEIVDEGAHVLVMNKTDWSYLMTMKDSNGQYLKGSFGMVPVVTTPGALSLNGMPVILSPAVPSGDFIILAPPPVSAELFLLDSGTLAFGYSGDGFKQNILTARFEVMGIHAVRNPYAYIYGQWDSAP